jgi:hypothetical protein
LFFGLREYTAAADALSELRYSYFHSHHDFKQTKRETRQLKGKYQSKLLQAGQLLKSALFDDPASRHTRLL